MSRERTFFVTPSSVNNSWQPFAQSVCHLHEPTNASVKRKGDDERDRVQPRSPFKARSCHGATASVLVRGDPSVLETATLMLCMLPLIQHDRLTAPRTGSRYPRVAAARPYEHLLRPFSQSDRFESDGIFVAVVPRRTSLEHLLRTARKSRITNLVDASSIGYILGRWRLSHASTRIISLGCLSNWRNR